MKASKRGFTLIELLVVIAILTMLMMLLLPAVLRARQGVLGVLTKGQITSLANACNSYYEIFNGYPGPVDNPPGSGTLVSGCQNMRLSLLGWSWTNPGSVGPATGSSVTPEYSGPADLGSSDPTLRDYKSTNMTLRPRIHDPFYSPKPEALVKHTYGLLAPPLPAGTNPDTPLPGYINADVVVDYHMTPPRPILYYRAMPKYVNKELFEFDDNGVYCTGTGEVSTNWSNIYVGTSSTPAMAQRAQVGFVLISAGPDRTYFTNDDFTNVNN